MADEAATNWLDVLRSALWPLIVLLLLYEFSGPISHFVNAAANGVGPAQEIEIGPIKLKLSQRAAAAIDPPSDDVATALAKLSPGEKEQLVSRLETGWNQVCLKGGYLDPNSPHANNEIELRFIDLGLTEFKTDDRERDNPGNGWCSNDKVRWDILSDLGRKVRRYLIDISIKAVEISKT